MALNDTYIRFKASVGRNHELIIWCICISLTVLAIVISILFFLGRPFGWYGDGYVIDNEVWGNLGDFIGGMFGPLLATVTLLMMWWTLRDQQKLSAKSNTLQQTLAQDAKNLQEQIEEKQNQQAASQRFNDMFFSLLDLYHRQVEGLTLNDPYGYTTLAIGAPGQYEVYTGSGKEFFSSLRQYMWDKSDREENYQRAHAKAIKTFSEVYRLYSVQLGVYFRTVYRIFNLIEEAGIPEKEKKNYIKIMRAQFTSSELFFLNYNANTMMGRPSQKYICMFRITKHLHLLNRLEFKFIVDKFTEAKETKREGLNFILYHLTEGIVDLVKRGWKPGTDNRYSLNQSTRYQFCATLDSPFSMTVEFINKPKRRNTINELNGLSDLDNDDLKYLLKSFMQVLFYDASYGRFNPKGSMKITTPVLRMNDTDKGVEKVISIRIKKTGTEPLRLTDPKWDKNPKSLVPWRNIA